MTSVVERDPLTTTNPSPISTPQAPERVNFATVLRHAGFRNLWLGQVVSQIGDYFAFLALMVVVSSFSPDPASTTRAVSGLMIAITLPRLVFGVLAGVFVDRWDRRYTMIGADLVRAVLTLALIPAFLAQNLWLVYALAFALAAFGTLFNPAKGALIPTLVPTEQLTAANALAQTSQMLSTLIGPALAGATFALVGAGNQWVAFVVNAISFLVSAVAVWLIPAVARRPAPRPAAAPDDHPLARVWQELLVGLKALVLNRTMATLSLVFGVTMLGIGAINVLWVVFLKTGFGFQTTELAWRLSLIDIAFSAGMVLASLVVGNFLAHIVPKRFIVWGLLVAGLATIPLGYLPSYWGVMAVMFVVGAFVAPINTGTTSLMQIVVPNDQLGRVGAGVGTVADTATLLSMSLAGILGALLGIPMVFLLGGVLCAGAGILAWIFLPGLTLQDKVADPADAQADQQLAA
ncbi:MAG: MFS transporter [Chloroflexia bacterium]